MDNLEKLYKKSFEDFERKPKGDFWVRLEPALPPKPDGNRKRRGLIFVFFAGLCAALFLSMTKDLWVNIADKELVAFPIFKQSNLQEKEQLIQIVENNKVLVDSVNQISSSNLVDKIAQNKDNYYLTTTKKENQIISENLIVNQILSTEKIDLETIITPMNVSKVKSSIFLNQAIIPLLPIKNRLLFDNKKQRKRPNKAKAKTPKFPYVSMEYTPASIGLFRIEDHLTNTKFTETMNINPTKGWAISGGIQFDNNLIFEVGVHHARFRLAKSQQVGISTNLLNATSTENGWIQQYSFQDIAITEPLSGNITVSAPNNAFQEGDIFLLNVDLQQSIKIFGLSSELGYSFDLSPRWSISPKIGVSANWEQKGKVFLNAATLADNRLQLLQSSLSNTNVTTTNLIEGLVTTEFAYRYSKRISITAAPQIRFSFNPFFNNYQRSVQHHFGQLQFGIRINL